MDSVTAGQWQEASRLLPPELASGLAAQTSFGAHGLHSQVGKHFPEAIVILKRRLQLMLLMIMRVQRGNLLFRSNTSLQARETNRTNTPRKFDDRTLPKPVMCVTPEKILPMAVSDQYCHLPVPFTSVSAPFFKGSFMLWP